MCAFGHSDIEELNFFSNVNGNSHLLLMATMVDSSVLYRPGAGQTQLNLAVSMTCKVHLKYKALCVFFCCSNT